MIARTLPVPDDRQVESEESLLKSMGSFCVALGMLAAEPDLCR